MIKILSTIGALMLLMGALAACIGCVAFDDANYTGLSVDNVSQHDVYAAHTALINYLQRQGTLNTHITWDGVYQPAFNENTRLHMDDVRGLFDLRRNIQTWGLILCMPLIAPFIRKNRRDAGYGLTLGAAIFALALIALIAWAVIDFTGAFNAFHRVFFKNDLWIMDPRTDLIIRMYPEWVFASIAARIAAYTAAVWAVVMTIGLLLWRTKA